MGKTAALNELPRDAFLFDVGGVQLADDEANAPTRFVMIANSGKPIAQHAWFGALGIDLKGVRWAEKVPVLLDHDTGRRLGVASKLAVTAKGLEVTGTFLTNDEAKSVIADSKAGFPFQASVYLRATKTVDLAAGAEHVVNGHKMTGPGVVFLESELREVTFTALGADPHTSAAALSGKAAGAAAASTTRNRTMSEQTPEIVQEAALAASRNEAMQAERDRTQAILNSAAPEQSELARTLIASGEALPSALLKLNADLVKRLAAAQAKPVAPVAALNSPNLQPLGAGNQVQPQHDEAARLAAMPDGEDKWKAQWASDAALRAEFDSESVYLAYERNKHRVSTHGSRAAKA